MKEKYLQRQVVSWFRSQYSELSLMFFAVPNGGSRNVLEAVELKRQGVVSGVADIILLVPNSEYHSLCIELKAEDNKQTDNQRQWQKEAEKNGNKYVVCRTIEEAMKEVKQYLNIDIYQRKT